VLLRQTNVIVHIAIAVGRDTLSLVFSSTEPEKAATSFSSARKAIP
jgi:hypothetical protein